MYSYLGQTTNTTCFFFNSTSGTNQTCVCGNKIVQSNEQCDDGNKINGDGCTSLCFREYCGDGIVNNVNQACDIGQNRTGSISLGCLNCQLSCGNGVVDTGEECDDGNRLDDDGCSSQCIKEYAKVGVIAGVTSGVTVALALLLLLIWFICRGKTCGPRLAAGSAYQAAPQTGVMMDAGQYGNVQYGVNNQNYNNSSSNINRPAAI